VLSAVQLDCEALIPAIEIENERPARLLSAELEARKAAIAKMKPDRGLGVGAGAAQAATASEGVIHAAVSAFERSSCFSGERYGSQG